MRKVAFWALVLGTLLACSTSNLDLVTTTSESGSIPEGGAADHSFSATESSPVTITVQPNEEEFDPVLEVLDSGGSIVAEADDGFPGEPELLIFVPTATGNYIARIRGFAGDGGTYQIGIVTQSAGNGAPIATPDPRLLPTASVNEVPVGDDGGSSDGLGIPPTWTPPSGFTDFDPNTGDNTVPTPAPGIPAGAETYTVQPGDTLANIASQFGVSVYDLAEANDIDNIDVIEVGQVLIIP